MSMAMHQLLRVAGQLKYPILQIYQCRPLTKFLASLKRPYRW